MEAKITITNKFLRKGEIKKLRAELELPASREHIEQTLRELQIDGRGENGEVDVEWKSPWFYVLQYDSRDINHIYELNHLAERIAMLDTSGRIKLDALCYEYLNEEVFMETASPNYEPSIPHAINLTHNLVGIKTIEDISNLSQLGIHCVAEKASGFEYLSEINPHYLNFDRIGKEYSDQLGGAIYFGHYVYNLPMPDTMITPYDGKSLLIEPGQEDGLVMGDM